MKIKKLRGHKRIFKNITAWKNSSLQLDLERLEASQRNYEKVWVRPFSDISITGNTIPKPKRKARKLILEGLIEIFNHWETQLKTLNKPYYLAIWLFDPHIENSQVVCAIDDFVNFYDITFYRPKNQRKMPTQNYGKLKTSLDAFNWVYALDENSFTSNDVAMTVDDYDTVEEFNNNKKYYKRKLKQLLKTYTNTFGEVTYYTNRGTIWIGTKNES